MPHPPNTEPLTPELEMLAAAAAHRLRAQVAGDDHQAADAKQAVVTAAGAALAAGVALSEIAAAEQAGHARAREHPGKELLRGVERSARRRRDAENEYQQAVARAATLGLALREIATAAQTTHGTIRAMIARPTEPGEDSSPPPEERGDAHAVIRVEQRDGDEHPAAT
jgi:hypothetical protein